MEEENSYQQDEAKVETRPQSINYSEEFEVRVPEGNKIRKITFYYLNSDQLILLFYFLYIANQSLK